MPGGQTNFNRHLVLIAVSNGTVKVAYGGTWNNVTNGSGALSATAAVVRSTQHLGKIYFADATNWKYYDPADNTVHAWTASQGTLPVDDNGNLPRLITTYRGRIVLSGLKDDPQNWFMSRVGDASDWDYSPASFSPTQAVAGNNGPLGLVPDVITSLVAYTDDIMYFGGDHTMWMLQGDPMAGGQIDLVSDVIGMAWGIPWCKDPAGAMYFVSNLCGIYSIVPGQQPVRISQQIEQLLATMPLEEVIIRLIWDDALQGLHVFVTRFVEATAATHFFWEQRTGAWWTDTFSNVNHNPMCCLAYEGNSPSDRVALIGSWDGYVRAFDAQSDNDDGEDIESRVVLGPWMVKTRDAVLVKDVYCDLGVESGDVDFSVLMGQTAEGALVGDPVATGTWSGGFNLPRLVRKRGHAGYVDMQSTVPWSMETVGVRIEGKGKVARRTR